jgi:TMEM175 potassium channel family protein
MVFFGDAAVAIAITLLVLPLTEAVPEAIVTERSSLDVIVHLQGQIYTFLLSFAVIARLWAAHHHLFEQVTSYNTILLRWHLFWVFTIVVLPFPTAMIAGFADDTFTPLLYIGTVLAASVSLTALVLVVHRNPDLRGDDLPEREIFNAVATTASLVVALGLAFIPGVGYLALFMLFVPPILVRLRYRATP